MYDTQVQIIYASVNIIKVKEPHHVCQKGKIKKNILKIVVQNILVNYARRLSIRTHNKFILKGRKLLKI